MVASAFLRALRRAAPVLLLLAGIAPSQAAAADDDWLYSEDWQFVVSPYAWLLSMDGDATIAGVKSDIDMPFKDILSDLNFMVEGRFEAHKGDWNIFIDPTLAWLSSDVDIGPISGEVDTDMALILAAVSRTLYRGPRSEGSDRNLKIEAGLGAAYVGLKSDFDLPAPLPQPSFRQSWVDAVITARATTEINDNWRWRLAGLVGGFGIGSASQLTWMLETHFGRRLGENTQLWFGYRVWSIDYERGSGASQFDLDVVLQGPLVGLAYRF